MLDLQPISLTRLLDGLARERPDRAAVRPRRPPRQAAVPDAGGAPAARSSERAGRGPDGRRRSLGSIKRTRSRCSQALATVKENLRQAIQKTSRQASWNNAMAETVNQIRCQQRRRISAAVPRHSHRRLLRTACPHDPARGCSPRSRSSAESRFYLAGGRYISTDNAYVGAAEGAHHARHFRQGQPRAGARRPARRRGRRRCSRSIRCRSSSRCGRRRASSTPSCTDLANLKSNYQSLKQARRIGPAGGRAQAPRCRPQDRARRQAEPARRWTSTTPMRRC